MTTPREPKLVCMLRTVHRLEFSHHKIDAPFGTENRTSFANIASNASVALCVSIIHLKIKNVKMVFFTILLRKLC